MRTVDIIQKKRDGGIHTREELAHLIHGYTKGDIPDEQISAWAMAVFFRGMNAEEMAALTLEMVASGLTVDWSGHLDGKRIVDKHSTGGVGDKTTIFVAPWAAACGLSVGKMSGRGLGHTGGTLDKLDAVPGFRTDLSMEAFQQQVAAIGIALISQTKELTPADAKLYALRDVTATVPSIPLIASSIMSKKIAAGAHAIVLDVKTGDGAFMKHVEESVQLAEAMVAIGNELGRKTVCWITNMDAPLGYAIGNSLEVQEAIQVLRGEGPADLTCLGETLVAELLLIADPTLSMDQALLTARETLADGSALAKMKAWFAAQGGDPSVIDQPGLLGQAAAQTTVTAAQDGYITAIRSESVGLSAMRMGAGRAKKSDVIDLTAGIMLHVKPGDFVTKGQVLCTLYDCDGRKAAAEQEKLSDAIIISPAPQEMLPLLIARVDADGVRFTT